MTFKCEEIAVGELQAKGILLVEDGNHGEYRPRHDEFEESGTAFIRAADMADGQVLFSSASRINGQALARIRKGIGKPGDILLSHKGTVGKVAFAPYDAPPFVCSPQTTFWRVSNDQKLDRDYLYAYMRSGHFKAKLSSRSGETDMAGYVSLTAQRQLKIPVPAIGIQRAVGSFLAALDGRIDNLRKTDATLEAIAQALFKSWFVDFAPVRAKSEGREPEGMDAATAALFPSEFEDSELGPIPRGWCWSSLGALCESRGGRVQTGPFGSQLHASDYIPVGVPVVMPQDLSGRRVLEDRIAHISSEDADRLKRHKVRPGDIVFSRRGDVGRHAVIAEKEDGWLCGTGCLLVRPGESELLSTFVSAALARPEAKEWLVRRAVGATMPNLNTKILSDLPLICPSEEVIRQFERISGPLEHRVSANLAQGAVLSELRDTLLPRLISGKLRLPEASVSDEHETKQGCVGWNQKVPA